MRILHTLLLTQPDHGQPLGLVVNVNEILVTRSTKYFIFCLEFLQIDCGILAHKLSG